MARKNGSDNNWVSWALFGALMFAIGRCSVAEPDQRPTTLMTADSAAGSSLDTSVGASSVSSEPAPESDTSSEQSDSSAGGLSLMTDSSSPQCGSKRYCREMNSCDEAMFYLNQCGLGRLDGDGDGVPCESIC